MAEQDNEVLDWGNEYDEVSLGDEDERYSLDDPVPPEENEAVDTPPALPTAVDSSRSSPVPLANDQPPTKPDSKPAAPASESRRSPKKTPTPNSRKLTLPTRLTHALPAKPVTASIPYVPPSDPTIVEATAMASRPTTIKKVDSSGRELKDGGRSDHIGPLPPQWEIRFSRDRPNEFYYYDIKFNVATWDRPTQPAAPPVADATPLSHDDRHYRPDGKNTSGTSRRYETSDDGPDTRHPRHHSSAGRSPARGRERSRSPSPQRDSRPRGNQRSARGRSNAKSNGSQKDPPPVDTSKDEDRHWVPSPTPNNMSRSARRQQIRAQNQANERAADLRPEIPARPPLPRETSERDNDRDRGRDRDKDRTFTPEYPSNSIAAPRPVTPPQQEVIYQTKTQEQPRRDINPPERQRSPGPIIDPTPPLPNRRDRPSRFGPGLTSAITERVNGLPKKPVLTPVERPAEYFREDDRQYTRRVEDRPIENIPTQYAPPPSRSPVQSRERWNDDKGRISPENLGSSSSRKRQPLPPQEAEFRGVGNPKSPHLSVPVSRSRDMTRSPSFSYQNQDNSDRSAGLPSPPLQPQRSYANREGNLRDVAYDPPMPTSREVVPDYHRGYEHEGDKPRTRQRPDDQNILDRGYDMPDDLPPLANSGRAGFSERDRDPPSKPRAMQIDSPVNSPTYAPMALSNAGPQHANRYSDRPTPPHFSMSDSRGEPEGRPVLHSSASWQERRDERREEKPYSVPERGAREPRGRQGPVSSANSIPIGNRRAFPPADAAVNDYPSNGPNGRLERQAYPPNDVPRQARNYHTDYPRPYPQKELVPEPRTNYSKDSRDDAYMQPSVENRTRRVDNIEPPQRNQAPLPGQFPENNNRQQQQRQGQFSGPRVSRFDNGQLPDPSPQQQKTWPAGYDAPHRERYANDPPRDPIPPPLSREPAYTSPQWNAPSPNYHDPPSQIMEYQDVHEYRNVAPPAVRMGSDLAPNRQVPMPSVLHGAPSQPVPERYRRKEVEDEGFARIPLPPPPRNNQRRDPATYSPEARRAPAPNVALDGAQRSNGGRPKWDQAGSPVDEYPHKRPRLLNERISANPNLPLPPLPDLRGGRKPQGIHQDIGYNGERDAYEVRTSGRMDRQDNYVPLPAKTFEQRLDPIDGPPPMTRGVSLLSRISHGDNDTLPSPSLRDRVQPGNKRDREEMVRGGHFQEASFEADDGDPDPAGARRRNKRRRSRRGGAPT